MLERKKGVCGEREGWDSKIEEEKSGEVNERKKKKEKRVQRE